jgi:hypothetical protein
MSLLYLPLEVFCEKPDGFARLPLFVTERPTGPVVLSNRERTGRASGPNSAENALSRLSLLSVVWIPVLWECRDDCIGQARSLERYQVGGVDLVASGRGLDFCDDKLVGEPRRLETD